MILRASSVGELVAPLLSNGSGGTVRRIFQNSAYLEVEGSIVLLMKGGLRSPMTVNLEPADGLADLLSISERFSLTAEGLVFGKVSVVTREAEVYRSSLGSSSPTAVATSLDLEKGAKILRMLYDVSPSALELIKGSGFRGFADSILKPLASGGLSRVYELQNYYPLIGAGGGFTPAGDDVVGGFAAAFNYAAGLIGTGKVRIPREELVTRTVPESAALMDYAQRGYVDEGFERLIMSAFNGNRGGFISDLFQVASRGHTSGLDVSVGVLLAAAAINDFSMKDGVLDRCLDGLGHR